MRTIYSLNTLGWHFGRKNVGAPDTVSPWQDVVLPHVWNKDDPSQTGECIYQARVYLKTQNCTKRQEKDIKGFYHRQYKEVIA